MMSVFTHSHVIPDLYGFFLPRESHLAA